LAATVGAGVIWTFTPGLEIAAATTNALGLLIPTGTGQVLDYYVSWIE
jgi:hypothetical protein